MRRAAERTLRHLDPSRRKTRAQMLDYLRKLRWVLVAPSAYHNFRDSDSDNDAAFKIDSKINAWERDLLRLAEILGFDLKSDRRAFEDVVAFMMRTTTNAEVQAATNCALPWENWIPRRKRGQPVMRQRPSATKASINLRLMLAGFGPLNEG